MVQSAVIYRDGDMIALNKPPGLPVQGGSRVARHLDAMLDALRFDATDAPRLVHRLDRDTSGVLVLARHAAAARELTALFRSRQLQKLYWALVVGVPKPAQGRIDAPLAKRQVGAGERVDRDRGGRPARDHGLRTRRDGRPPPLVARTHAAHGPHPSAPHPHRVGLRPPRRWRRQVRRRGSVPGWLRAPLAPPRPRVGVPRPGGKALVLTAPLPPHMAAAWRFLGFDPEPAEDHFAVFEAAP